MARITISENEAEEGVLPPICMICGTPATQSKRIHFSWAPTWTHFMLPIGLITCVGIWLWVIFRAVKHRSLDASVPLCNRHGHYWLKRMLVVPLGIFASLGVLIGGTVALDQGVPGLATMLISIGLLIGSLCFAGLLLFRGTRVKLIENHQITFEDVNPGFAEAVETSRREYETKMKQWLGRRDSGSERDTSR